MDSEGVSEIVHGPRTMFVSGFNFEDDDEGVEGDGDLDEDVREVLQAAENGHTDTVRTILDNKPHLVHCKDNDAYTPMHRAAYNNHEQTLALLIERGGSVNAVTENGWQPLHCAACWGCANTARVLIASGKVDVNASTNGKVTALHLAAACTEDAQGAKEVAKALLNSPNIKIFNKNSAGDTAEDLARRSSKLVFEAICEFKSANNHMES